MSVQKKVVYGYCINHPCTRKAKSLLFGTVAYAFGMRVVAKHSNKQSPTFFSFGRLRASLVRKKKKKGRRLGVFCQPVEKEHEWHYVKVQ